MLKLPTITASNDQLYDQEPALELTAAEMVGVSKWLDLAITDVALQGKALVDNRKKQTIIHNNMPTEQNFKAELRGYDVVLNWLRAMKAMVDEQLLKAAGEFPDEPAKPN